MASSSSSSSQTYDVFLSFRGQDTRRNLTGHLYSALKQSGIHVFRDDEELERGEEISPSLLQAIERSRIALVILSPDYASSRWCLDELVNIMECRRSAAQVVVPIFYNINPSDVRHQRGTYGEAMERHEQRLGGEGDRRVLRWRQALTEISNLSGFDSTADRSDVQLVDTIVKYVLEKVDAGQLFVAKHPVGIESRVQQLASKLSTKRFRKALIIGLWGMGGVGITTLIERSLINVNRNNNRLEMHDLLRNMGREIICGSPRKDPEDRSRLWFQEDVTEVLMQNTATKVIEGISLKKPHEVCEIDSKAFKAMRKLRLLQLEYVNLEGDYRHLSNKLRWLCWHGFPLKSIPDSLHQKSLVVVDFKYSNLRLVWKKPQLLPYLTILILSHSPHLRQTPDFTNLPNLEKLVLKDCPSLVLIHQSIGDLKKIILVNLKDCKCLRVLPRSIYKLKSLRTLVLSGCSLIDHLEEDIEQMESMTVLKADHTAITVIPKALARLEALKHGYVSFPGREGRAQDVFPSLIWSWMSPTNIPQSSSEEFLLSMSSLVFSVIQNGRFLGLSPFLGDLAKLQGMWEECRSQSRFNGEMARLMDALYGTNFMDLESAPSRSGEASTSFDGHDQVHNATSADFLPSLLIQMAESYKVDLLRDKILQGSSCGGWDDSNLPGDQYPDWFIYKGEGRSVIFKAPQVIGCHLKAMLLNVAYSSSMDNTRPQFFINVLIINYTKAYVKQCKGDSATFHEDAKWQSIISSIQPGDQVELILSIGPQFPVKKIVAYLIYDGSM
ncbi:TMV resistance protein N-like [Neltuma alba]|uniref:TMV resistance protein N-like n=1 Tax=Neltuma alba TaxID=207710 RepID=UPI0010A3AF24|nr:TMV resistance protein N-like [Prosopis alba]